MRLKLSFVALAVMALAAASFAQDQGGQGGQGGGGRRQGGGMRGMQGMGRMGAQRLTQLIRNPQVQTELKVTDDQKTKIEALPRAGFGGGRGQGGPGGGQGGNGGGQGGGRGQGMTPPTPEEQAKQLADDKAATSAILTPEQEKRLEELRIQWAGPNAILLPDVQDSLALTADQKTKITDLQTKMGTANRSLMEKVRNQEIDMQDAMSTMQKNNETFGTEVAKVLTADQTAKLKTLGGTELKPDMSQMRGGFGGGRRGGNGGGGNGTGTTPPPFKV